MGGLLRDGVDCVVLRVDDGEGKPEHLGELGDVHPGDDAGEEHLVDDVKPHEVGELLAECVLDVRGEG